MMQLSLQTWDTERSLYQAVNCTGISRSYSVTIAHNTSSTINVRESHLISPILFQPGIDITQSPGNGNISFMQDYIFSSMAILGGAFGTDLLGTSNLSSYLVAGLPVLFVNTPLPYIFGLGSYVADGNFTWSANMTAALEEYAQNLTLSLLSGQIFPFGNVEESTLLENSTTQCVYRLTAYEYTPYRLFLPYGIAVFLTLLCVAWGAIAIQINGVDESMDFSRLLRAVLNQRMYRWYAEEGFELDTNSRIKADETIEGVLAPVIDELSDDTEDSLELEERSHSALEA